MSEIKRNVPMNFNDEYVGTAHIWDDGNITAEFAETNMGAACVSFLVAFALRMMLREEGAFGEFKINLN